MWHCFWVLVAKLIEIFCKWFLENFRITSESWNRYTSRLFKFNKILIYKCFMIYYLTVSFYVFSLSVRHVFANDLICSFVVVEKIFVFIIFQHMRKRQVRKESKLFELKFFTCHCRFCWWPLIQDVFRKNNPCDNLLVKKQGLKFP